MADQPLKALCYAVIFTSVRTDVDNGYNQMAERLLRLAKEIPGFIGLETARENIGITVSYWDSLEAIERWKKHPVHVEAQKRGKDEWYEGYTSRVCIVVRESGFSRP